MKLPIEQIFVSVDLLTHLPPFSAAADFRQQAILLHDAQHGFRVAVDILALKLQTIFADNHRR